jgi:hypothetical protein
MTRAALGVAVALAVATAVAGNDPQGLSQLFDGKSLAGWKHVGRGRFVVADGMLKTEGGMGLLWYTRERISNAVLRVVYRNPRGVNSGVFVRIPHRPAEPWMPVYKGYEVQIADDPEADDYHYTGALESFSRVLARPARPDEWNVMEITLDGPKTSVTINGVLVTELREGDPVPAKKERWEGDRVPRPPEGYVGLQNYDAQDVVYFREVSVRPLH